MSTAFQFGAIALGSDERLSTHELLRRVNDCGDHILAGENNAFQPRQALIGFVYLVFHPAQISAQLGMVSSEFRALLGAIRFEFFTQPSCLVSQ